ncbi:J domain-containing protein [Ramlibacter alkalitolerans]|uniref:Molecular chaperone DnaJ n=1 Tax=Ramlibacter alkalitolerans TaxID=2039631 RepID=A0ABS1JN25_9BURK|nr:J domain-containing protein [Ramlibacter alkalitolerans]MBL0425634.1 molecular chaperone DnaJ [Ramlibacter alkalitolerans]
MSRLPTLHIAPASTGAALGPQQKRFNTLIRQIEQARATLASWNENIPLYRQAHGEMLAPLRRELQASSRQWLSALDALCDGPGWTRTERATLRDLICETASAMLGAGEDDDTIKALFDKHSEVDFATEQREITLAMKDFAEEMTGLDLGDDEGIEDEDALRARVRKAMEERDAAEEARRASKPARKKSAAQQRRDAEAQQATQSVREIYRKLASSLHPDRETDEGERAAKTELMQQVNQAYAAGDLLALLELQLRIEQIDANHVAGASEARLKHYNKVLAEQLAELRQEIEDAQVAWSVEFNVPPFMHRDPRRLGDELERTRRAWRGELARLEKDVRLFADVAATRRWLKRQRARLAEDDLDLPF